MVCGRLLMRMAALLVWPSFPLIFMSRVDLGDHPNLLTVQIKRRKLLRLQVQHQGTIIYKWNCMLVSFKERNGGMQKELQRKKRKVMLKEQMNKQKG